MCLIQFIDRYEQLSNKKGNDCIFQFNLELFLKNQNGLYMKTIVQISLDLTNIDEALETAAMAMRAGVDWLEAGTPLILAEGLI